LRAEPQARWDEVLVTPASLLLR